MSKIQSMPCQIKSNDFEIVECVDQGKLCFGFTLKNKFNDNEMKLLQQDLKKYDNVKYLRKYLYQNPQTKQYLFERPQQYSVLRNLIKPEEKIIIKIISDILTALFTLHQNKSVGRCFNIDNIIFVQDQHACLMMFGFFPEVDYLLPEEQIQVSVNEKIDVFHLGRVLFYLMVGRELPKYTVDNFANLDEKINFELANTQYSQNLKSLAMSLLHKDRQKRFELINIVEKFKTHSSFSQMNQFYSSQSNLAQIVSQIEEKNDVRKKSIIQFGSEPSFTLIGTGQLVEIEKNKKQNISFIIPKVDNADDLLPPDSDDDEKDKKQKPEYIDDNDLMPPDFISSKSRLLKGELYNKYQKNIKLTEVLYYFNKNLDQNLQSWNQIYYSFYRISLIKKLLQEIKSYQNLADSFELHVANFALIKMILLIKKELSQSFQNEINIFAIDETEWRQFVKTDEFSIMKKFVKTDLDQSIIQFNSTQCSQFKNTKIKFGQESFTNNFISEQLEYYSFDTYKTSFRSILNNVLSFFQNVQGQEIPYILLLVFFAILINKILDPQLIENNFNCITKYIGQDSIDSFIDIERFLQLKNQQFFDQLKSHLIQTYFGG